MMVILNELFMIFPGLIIVCDGDGISWTIPIRIMTKVMVNLVITYQDDAGDGLLQITFLSLIKLFSQFYPLLLAEGCPRGMRLIFQFHQPVFSQY